MLAVSSPLCAPVSTATAAASAYPASTTPARRVTFAELFCTQRQLDPSTYPPAAFRATLHLPARSLYLLLTSFDADFFAADHDLISNIGQLTSPADLDLDFEEYRYHPQNQSRLRRFLLLSTSHERVSALVRATFRAAT